VPFVFAVGRYLKTPQEARLAAALSRYWRNFAYSGDPSVPPPWDSSGGGGGGDWRQLAAGTSGDDDGGGGAVTLPMWPAFDEASDRSMQLGTAPDGSLVVETALRKEQCVMWDECDRHVSCWNFSSALPPSQAQAAAGVAAAAEVDAYGGSNSATVADGRPKRWAF
jgi:hypothetical protein